MSMRASDADPNHHKTPQNIGTRSEEAWGTSHYLLNDSKRFIACRGALLTHHGCYGTRQSLKCPSSPGGIAVQHQKTTDKPARFERRTLQIARQGASAPVC